MIPIPLTESAIAYMARSFGDASGHDLEVFGYWIGMDPDRLTHLILPKYLIGIRKDTNGAMDHATSTRCRSTVMFATEANRSELGILVNTCPEGDSEELTESRWVFIPHALLILNRPIATYLPTDTCREYFPGVPPDKVSPTDIAAVIKTSGNRRQTNLLDQLNHWNQYHFLPNLSIHVDAFISNSRIYPMNRFILNALGTNRFTRTQEGVDKTIYGRVHIHYAYRTREILGDALINALNKKDKYFYELMTPVDAISMLDSAKAVREISYRRQSMAQQIEAIVALDPDSLDVVGRSYFDLQVLESASDINTMQGLAHQACQSRDVNAHIQWFDYIRRLSTPHLP